MPKRARAVQTGDSNALSFAHDQSEAGAEVAAHVKKRKLKNSSLIISFDPDAHREFVTGFQKRKQERRKKAQKQVAEKERKQRLEEKAEKRAKLREELDLARYETESDVDDLPDQAAKGDNKSTKVYKGPSAITTVTTSALHMYSDEEPDKGGSAEFEEPDTVDIAGTSEKMIRSERQMKTKPTFKREAGRQKKRRAK